MNSGTIAEVDFRRLNDEGRIEERKQYESLDEALSAYKHLHEALSIAAEVPYYEEEVEPFQFDLYITAEEPYVITTQIYLV